jgi:hypothetical protein
LGKWDVPGYLLTSSESMPYDDNNIEAVRPVPPPPTIKTGTVISLNISSLELMCSTISWYLPGIIDT